MKLLALLLVTAGLIGCSKADNKESEPSVAKQAIEGFTGKTAVKHGEQAKDRIKAVSAEENKNLNEVMNGM